MRTIYNGGFLPALAIDDFPESPSWGWLMAKNPLDGQWVTIANLSAQITAQTDDVIDAQIATLNAKLERVRESALLIRADQHACVNIANLADLILREVGHE